MTLSDKFWCRHAARAGAEKPHPARFCLWGGGERWVQVGSPTDRRLQTHRRMVAGFERMGTAIGRTLLPAVQQATDSLAGLAKAFEQSRSWL